MNKKSILSKNITAVVRSVSERTESLCINLLREDLNDDSIIIVKNVAPFSKAHKSSMEEGVKSGKKYTLIIDADVLVRKNSIWNIFKLFEAQNKDVFEVHTLMLDKFFGGFRYGGIKLYRTNLIEGAINLIPEDSIRPETDMILSMKENGYHWVLFKYKACLHDFYQSYVDIFRKGYTHAAKHSERNNNNVQILLPYWKREAAHDDDFKILLQGFDFYNNNTSKIKLDFNETPRDIKTILNKLKISEKKEIDVDNYDQQQISNIMRSFTLPKEYHQVKNQLESNLPKDTRSLINRYKAHAKYCAIKIF